MKDVLVCANCQYAKQRFFRIVTATFQVTGYQIDGFGAGIDTIDKKRVSTEVLWESPIGLKRNCPKLGLLRARNVGENAKCVNPKAYQSKTNNQ